MVRYAFIAVAGMASMAIARPLNINLGAYSPALVVGDGEISFGGNEDVSSLMNVLEGAAVNAASSVAKTAGTTATTATTNAAKAEGSTTSAAATTSVAVAAAAASASSTDTEAAAAVDDPTLQEQAQQIATLQGLGKEISPRVQLLDTAKVEAAVEDDAEDDTEDAEDEASSTSAKEKRDLSGFDRALTYAEAALTKGPKIQLGTGVEGSGVGIIVDNNQVAAARAGKGTTETTATARRRDVTAEVPKRVRAKVTTMYVRSGVPASLQSRNDARDLVDSAVVVPRQPAVEVPAVVSSTALRRDAVDEVNLNVDGNQGLTMTFVETVEDDDDE